MTDSETFDRLRLIRSPNVGPISYRQLVARFGSAGKALEALPDLAARVGGRKFTAASPAAIEHEIGRLEQIGGRYAFIDDGDYPVHLGELENAPPVLTYKGDIGLARRVNVAMVGARNASAAGCRMARTIAQELGERDVIVTSGLARGIDAAAHLGALATGTVAVIAGGLDIVYPPEHAELQARIAAEGLLIAEMPPGIEPRARHFPYRNRIIAGVSAGTVVVEAIPKSGSLITARLAGEAGREVMAIPGSPLDPRSRGCNQLIREGATLVQDAAEIAELIAPLDQRVRSKPAAQPLFDFIAEAGDGERQAIVELLSPNFAAVDELVRLSGMPSAQVQMVLVELELAGRLERGAGARVRLTA
ncbi:MAG: DNA-protecting protein DprA [Sphingomonadales bacterium]|nr:DNA-protecting protein DprA [Sphingomonadales bacterium]MBK9268711.1 DNA-protecting protein DprA [Sphingomonadales bacterium]MBP6435476.1 DNA-processing protein DprA [Sphingorhabdus sp.]